MTRFLTIGNLLVEDIVMPDGRELRDRLGGDAIYAAAGVRAFADDVLPVVRLGRGFPDELLELLEAAGYAEGLLRSEHPVVRLRVEWGVEDESRFTFEPGSGTYLQATPRPDELPGRLADGLESVHVAPIPFEQMAAWVEWARPRARVLTVDPHYQHLDADWRRILPLVDAFLPSRDEAAGILGGWPGAEQAVEALAGLGARMVCIKLGAEGAIGIHAGSVARAGVVGGPVVDATGCGDAFCGGFLAGLTASGDLATAIAHGSAAASFASEDHGAAHALRPDRAAAEQRRLELRRP